jgi:hypothetical protein
VTLVALAINGMVNTVDPAISALLYVDDVAISYSPQSLVTIEH